MRIKALILKELKNLHKTLMNCSGYHHWATMHLQLHFQLDRSRQTDTQTNTGLSLGPLLKQQGHLVVSWCNSLSEMQQFM